MSTIPFGESLELASTPIVDAHCHPMRPLNEPLTVTSLERQISLGFMDQNQLTRSQRGLVRDWPADSLPRPTLMQTYLFRRLAEFLDVPPLPEQVVAAREKRARDYPAYVRDLMDSAGIAQLVADSGFPGNIPCREFADVARRPVWEVVRIDQVMTQEAATAADFGDFEDAVRQRLDAGLRRLGVVGLKSVIAYLTGLAIGPQDRTLAAGEYRAYRQDPWKRSFRALRDYFFHLGMQLCIEHSKPLQVHCGFGSDDIRFSLSAPHHLYELLVFRPYSDCLLVLVHGGHPWAREAAVMVNVLPNVYLDISETCPFVSYGVADLLWEVLQIAPTSKVMYGSDAFHLPELYWLAAQLGRRAVGEVLTRLISAGFATRAEARQIAAGILHDNAVDLYGLDPKRLEGGERPAADLSR